jgi:hypothetical protein
MAKQLGIFQIGGTLDNVTFYREKDGTYAVKKKGFVSAERIATDPAFARTRENGRQFGRAGKSGKLLRTALRPILVSSADHRMVSRLVQRLMLCMKADPTQIRGEQTIAGGDLTLLNGFDFNKSGGLSTVLFAPYTATLDRVTGALDVVVPAFIPAQLLSIPTGATHFKLMAAGTAIEFETEVYEADQAESAYLAIGNTATVPVTLSISVTPNSTKHLVLTLAVKFYQDFNGAKYALNNGHSDPVAVVGVDH